MDHILHRDLSNSSNQTNLHLHYDLPYPEKGVSELISQSLFSLEPEGPPCFEPRDSSLHKPLTPSRVLQKKLHWLTLGGQYDWTNRIYPQGKSPLFPQDLHGFLHALFPETRAEAAIVNFYSPADTMMMHRDVSEETMKGLVSLSFGCDSLFMISPNPVGSTRHAIVVRLRSGDAIYMMEEARVAWHGVPKIIRDTCPPYLQEWPANGDDFHQWRGWMAGKRINLNVRQMKE